MADEEPREARGKTKIDLGLYAFVFTIVLSVYVATLMPSVPGGDSGELVAEACELGTAHPPGYPLYTLVVHLLTYVPVGTMAWRANLFCAALGALASANIAATAMVIASSPRIGLSLSFLRGAQWTVRVAGAASGGFMYAFSPLVWTYSVGSEVFSMNNFFASLVVLFTVRFAAEETAKGRRSIAVAGAFICGLGMCNQHTLILYELPLVAWFLWTLHRSGSLSATTFVALASAFFVGLSPYVYLPIASILFPKRGAWGDMSSLVGFWRHLRRADYGTFQLYSRNDETQGLSERVWAHLKDFSTRQGLWVVGPLFAGTGLVCCLWAWHRHRHTGSGQFYGSNGNNGPMSSKKEKSRKLPKKLKRLDTIIKPEHAENQSTFDHEGVGMGSDVCLALLFAFVFYELGFHSLSNLPLENPLLFGIHARFWMQPNVLLFTWVGIGLIFATEFMLQRFQKLRTYLELPAIALLLAFVGAQIWRWFPLMDQTKNRYLEGYARGILESLPPNSLFFTNYDQQWTASRYLHVCEGVRKDIPFINLSMMTFWWFYRQRELFPEISWPSMYLAGSNTKQYARGEAFTFKELLDANIDRFPGGRYSLRVVDVCHFACACFHDSDSLNVTHTIFILTYTYVGKCKAFTWVAK